jgi:hypothetical protein
MESHLQIKGTETLLVLSELRVAATTIVESGGTARSKPMPANGPNVKNGKNGKPTDSTLPYYVDDEGVKRCNRLTVEGERCGQPVTQREGQYGPFWSCKNYKNHVSTKGGRARE